MLCYPLVFRFYSVGSYMYTVGLDVDTSLFHCCYYDIAVPTVLKFSVVSYSFWSYLRLRTPMLFVLGFLILFTLGGLSGVVS